MKKPILWIFASVAAGAALFLGVIWIMASLDDGNKGEEIAAKEGNSPYATTEDETKAQTGFIDGIEQTIQHDAIATYDAALDTLHKMTHQKVTAEDKWGAIPMIKANVLAAKEQIAQLTIKEREELLEILAKWEKVDFSEVDHDHNYFWNKQGGTIGKAYGIMSEEQEKAFIENNFKEYLEKE